MSRDVYADAFGIPEYSAPSARERKIREREQATVTALLAGRFGPDSLFAHMLGVASTEELTLGMCRWCPFRSRQQTDWARRRTVARHVERHHPEVAA